MESRGVESPISSAQKLPGVRGVRGVLGVVGARKKFLRVGEHGVRGETGATTFAAAEHPARSRARKVSTKESFFC